MDDRTQKNLEKMTSYVQFYDTFLKLDPPGRDDEPWHSGRNGKN